MTEPPSGALDHRNKPLYDELLSARVKFQFDPSGDEGWGARYDPSTKLAEIVYSSFGDPAPALTHELLHTKFEIEGYQKPVQCFKSPPTQDFRDWVNGFLSKTYNHLMHFKMLPVFVEMGFQPADFVVEDTTALNTCRALIAECESSVDRLGTAAERHLIPICFVRAFFLISASPPTPALSLRPTLKKVDQSAFDQLHRYLEAWKASKPNELCWFMARMFFLCGYHDVGFGYADRDPLWAAACSTERRDDSIGSRQSQN